MRKKWTYRKIWRFERKCGHFEGRTGFVTYEIDPKRIELSRNGPQVSWHYSPHNWITFQMRQKQQLVILNDFKVVAFSRNPEVGWTQASANACSLTYVWHFSDLFLWENCSTRTGDQNNSKCHFDRSFSQTLPWLLERWRALFAGWITIQRISPIKTNWAMHDINVTAWERNPPFRQLEPF